MSFPPLCQQSHHPHGLLTPCFFKKTFLSPTHNFSYCFVSLLSSQWQMSYISKRRVINGQMFTELDPWNSTYNSLCPFPHLFFLAPSIKLLPHHPPKLLLSGYPGIPSSHILCFLNLSETFNTVESCLRKILILPKAEPETKTCK